jgi:phosphoglycolate phosphatase
MNVLVEARCLLIDFDGPVCTLFAGHPAAAVAGDMRLLISRHFGGELPPALAALRHDPLRILVEVAALGDERLTREVAKACREGEATAVRSAMPTAGAEEVLSAARDSGRRVGVVSNNGSDPVHDYLREHGLIRYIDGLVARVDGMHPRLLKPHPFLLERSFTATRTEPEDAVFVGDAVTDIEAGHAAGIRTIGYANKPGKHEHLTAAGADAVIGSMLTLAAALRETPVGPPPI